MDKLARVVLISVGTMSFFRQSALVCALTLFGTAGCATDDSGPGGKCTGGKCDFEDDIVCEVNDRTLRNLSGSFVEELSDPIAQFVLRGGDACPTTFQETLDKLERFDNEDCVGAGNGTMVVSETAQAKERADSYRVVTNRRCNDREQFGLMFSAFGLTTDDEVLPDNVEIIAREPSTGVFNYYTVEDGEFNFFGNSKMFADEYLDRLAADFEAPFHGFAREDELDVTLPRCAACHTGGGLIMKELNNPWVHWEGKVKGGTPGAAELVDAHAGFGSKKSGQTLEFQIVKPGNIEWTKTRIDHVIDTRDARDLLAPLFCTVEINLDTMSPSNTENNTGVIPGDFFMDTTLFTGGDGLSFADVDVGVDNYERAIAAAGQRVETDVGIILKAGNRHIKDTIIPFVFPERSEADKVYVRELLERGIIDEELLADISVIDFTRPIFSDARCALLDFVPRADVSRMSASRIKSTIEDGMVEALEQAEPTAGSAEAQLLANLLETNQSEHESEMRAFSRACKDRPADDMMTDIMRVASAFRHIATHEPRIMEFRASMPVDDLFENSGGEMFEVSSGLHVQDVVFDRATCTISDQ